MTGHSKYIAIVTPKSMVAAANNLMAAITQNEGDLETFRVAKWKNKTGALFSVACAPVTPGFLIDLTTMPAEQPESFSVDMTKARTAFNALVKVEDPDIYAATGKISYLYADNTKGLAKNMLGQMGLTEVVNDD